MMINFKELKKCSLDFIILSIYLVLMVFIPKSFSTLFNFIPIRLFLTSLFIIIITFHTKGKSLSINSKKIKILLILYGIFLLFTIPSIFVSKSFFTSCYTFMKFMVIPFLMLICINLKPSNEDKKLFYFTIVFISLILVLFSFIQYKFNIDLLKLGTEKYPGAKGRVSTTFFNTIYYGIFLNFISCIFVCKFLRSKDLKINVFYFISIILIYISLLLTFTRSAFLIFSGILFIILILLISKKNLIKIGVMIISIVLLTFVIPGAKYMVYDSINDGFELLFNVNLFDGKVEQIKNSSTITKQENSDFDENNDKKINDNVSTEESEVNNNAINNENNDKKINDNVSTEESKVDNNAINNENKDKNKTTSDDKNDIKYNGDLSLLHREQFSDIAKRIGDDHIFTGVGLGAYIDYMNSEEFNTLYPDYIGSKTHPHSTVVLLYAECGIISVFSFFMFLVLIPAFSFIRLLKNIKYRNNDNFILYLCSFVISIGFTFINIIAENAIYDTQIFPLFIIIVFVLYSFSEMEN